jgi:hypothetical protein
MYPAMPIAFSSRRDQQQRAVGTISSGMVKASHDGLSRRGEQAW